MATIAKKSRQARALNVLEQQLKNDVKTQNKTTNTKIPLTDADVKRINKEIEVLKTRV